MSKGNPNDSSRKNNFIAKVWDDVRKEYRPIYEAPEATSTVLGDVYLSDSVTSSDGAAKGVTAATPLAVKTVQDNANTKLSMTTGTAQTVNSAVTFKGLVTGSGGFSGNLTGNVAGNASTATKLKEAKTITVKSGNQNGGSATFDGSSNITITLPAIDATDIVGTIPLSNIPQGALDRVVSYNSISAAVSAWTGAADNNKPFDIGDTIRVIGVTPNVMYAVVGDPSNSSNYVEYAAGTASEATNAEHADSATKLSTARTIRTNLASTSTASFDGTANITPGVTGTLPVGNGGTGITSNPSVLVNLASTSADTAFKASPRPGITGTLAIAHGGTGATSAAQALTNLGAASSSHTHGNFKGATADDAGAAGFVPAPAAGYQGRFLRGDGTWATVNAGVTGVKGNAESSYRTGNVNLTPANIGAATASHTHNYLPLTGGTLTGQLTSRAIIPSADSTYNIGSSSVRFANIYADNFTGNLSGNATSATTATTASRLNNTLTLTGNVTGSASFNQSDAISLSTTIADGAVTAAKIASNAVTTAKIADSNVTLAKLGSDVGTVAVQSATPTDDNIKIWVKI